MTKTSHYPTYDVMEHEEAWDPHTQSIVKARLVQQGKYRFLDMKEVELLRAWCSRLMDDDRAEIIGFVLEHIDSTLTQNKGESQRDPNVPEARDLVRRGLHDIDALAESLHGMLFYNLEVPVQLTLMSDICTGLGQQGDERLTVPPKALFKKLLVMTIEAYYSHPKIWSEIGYGGPAYPRGYVRLENGQLDPWEAKTEQ